MIKITFPDGAVREFESGTTTSEIAESISKSLAKKPWLVNLTAAYRYYSRYHEDGSIEIVTPDHEDAFESCATRLPTCSRKQLVAFFQIFTWGRSSYRRWFLLRYGQ